MPDMPDNKKPFSSEIGEKEQLKLKAARNKNSVWAGFGLFGMIGWSVAVPTLLGTALGVWLDKRYPQHFSWTLSCLLSGLVLGCIVAWNWVSKENKAIHKKEENNQ
jgi:ATP synthase protein I